MALAQRAASVPVAKSPATSSASVRLPSRPRSSTFRPAAALQHDDSAPSCSTSSPIACGMPWRLDERLQGRTSVQFLAAAALAAGLQLFSGTEALAVPQTSSAGENLGFLSDEEVAQRRSELGFARAFDGKVALQSTRGQKLWDVKLDLKSPGTLLLRSPEGRVFYLAFESLKQIDLSDDEVVGAIASSPWETGMQPVEALDDGNQVRRLELTREGFFNLVSVVEAPEP